MRNWGLIHFCLVVSPTTLLTCIWGLHFCINFVSIATPLSIRNWSSTCFCPSCKYTLNTQQGANIFSWLQLHPHTNWEVCFSCLSYKSTLDLCPTAYKSSYTLTCNWWPAFLFYLQFHPRYATGGLVNFGPVAPPPLIQKLGHAPFFFLIASPPLILKWETSHFRPIRNATPDMQLRAHIFIVPVGRAPSTCNCGSTHFSLVASTPSTHN